MLRKNNLIRYVIAITAISACIFSVGCSKESKDTMSNKSDTTVEQLLQQYNQSVDNEVHFASFRPVYNIGQNQGFELQCKSLPDDLKDVVTVYRDEIQTGNEVTYRAFQIEKNREKYLMILPDENNTKENAEYTKHWGDSNAYYMTVNYNLDGATPLKLETPSIIYFTVASPVPAVQLNYKVDEKGNLSLFWDKVQEASQYRVYQKKTNNELECIATTQVPEYYFRGESQADGLAYTSHYITSQNSSISGEYFVTATFDTKESNLSNGIKISDIGDYIPQILTSDFFSKEYASLSELPQTATIKTLNGETIEKKVLYDYENVNQNNLTTGFEVNYAIQDTELTGYVQVKSATVQELTGCITMGNYTAKIEQPFSVASNIPIQNKTITNYSINSVKTDETRAFIDLGMYKIRQNAHYEECAKEIVPEIPAGYKINVSNAIEDYISRHLFHHSTTINLSLFPEASNCMYLEKTMNTIVQNNPLILGVASYAYDYTDAELDITYYDSGDKTWLEKQKELLTWVKQYIEQNVYSTSDEIEIEQALYDFLVEGCNYDYEALANAKQNCYAAIDDAYIDSFNAYGTLINKLGTPEGYTLAFKLLCDYKGIECKVISGTYKDIPHIWNVVNIDGIWAYVDVSNNYISSGIPYPVFNLGELPQEYTISSNEIQLETTNKDGYYEEEGLAFTSEDTLKNILQKKINENATHFVLKNNAKNIDNTKACAMIATYIHNLVTEVEFSKYFIGIDNDFIVISKTE